MKRAGHLFLRSEESVESIFLLFFRQIAVSLFFDKRFGLYFIFSTFVKLIKKRINMEFRIKGCIGASVNDGLRVRSLRGRYGQGRA